MSKAKDLAEKAYPVVMTTLIPADEEHPLIEQDCNKFKREAYIKGYEQAEKDLELTWEDIRKIISIDQQVCGAVGISAYVQNHQQVMKEVLKRFRDYKK